MVGSKGTSVDGVEAAPSERSSRGKQRERMSDLLEGGGLADLPDREDKLDKPLVRHALEAPVRRLKNMSETSSLLQKGEKERSTKNSISARSLRGPSSSQPVSFRLFTQLEHLTSGGYDPERKIYIADYEDTEDVQEIGSTTPMIPQTESTAYVHFEEGKGYVASIILFAFLPSVCPLFDESYAIVTLTSIHFLCLLMVHMFCEQDRAIQIISGVTCFVVVAVLLVVISGLTAG